MTNEHDKLVDNVAAMRQLTDASIAKLNIARDNNLVWLRDTASSFFDFLRPVVERRNNNNVSSAPLCPPPSRTRRPPRARVAVKPAAPPLPSIRKTRRAAKTEQRELVANADKENVENQQTAMPPPKLPGKRVNRARKGQTKRAPLTPMRADPNVAQHVPAVEHEPEAAPSEKRGTEDDDGANAEIEPEKAAQPDLNASVEKRNSTPFISALSHHTDPGTKKVSGQLLAPDFGENGRDAQDADQGEPERDGDTAMKDAGDEETTNVAEAIERTAAPSPRRSGRSSTSDEDYDDARDGNNRSSAEHDAMDISSDEGSPTPVQRLTRSRVRHNDEEEEIDGKPATKKRVQRPAAKGKARPKKIARTEQPSPEAAPEMVHSSPERQSPAKETEVLDSPASSELVSTTPNAPKEASVRNQAETSDSPRFSKNAHLAKSRESNRRSSAGAIETDEPQDPREPDSSSGLSSSDEETPVRPRRGRPRNAAALAKAASSARDNESVASQPPVEQQEEVPTESESAVRANEVSQPVSSMDIVEESALPQQINSSNRETEEEGVESGPKDDESDNEAQHFIGFRAEDQSKDSAENTNGGNGEESLSREQPKSPVDADRQLQDGDDLGESPVATYKMPKPRRRAALTGISGRVEHGVTFSSQLSAVKEVPQTPQGQVQSKGLGIGLSAQSDLKQRFIVDENGKLGQHGIGALSEILTTPSTVGRSKPLQATGADDQGSVRSNRLFRPTNNIYSAKKSGALSVQKALGANSSRQILRTPGARTPGKAVRANPEGYPRSILKRAISQNLAVPALPGQSTFKNTALLGKSGSGLRDLNEKHGRSGLHRELSFRDPVLHKPQETADGSGPGHFKKQLEFSSAGHEYALGLEQSTELRSEQDVHDEPVLDSKSEQHSHLSQLPNTAPGQRGPRPRIEGKFVKSALRCKIEKLFESRPSSTRQVKGKDDTLNPDVVEDRASSEKQNALNDSDFVDAMESVPDCTGTSPQLTKDSTDKDGSAKPPSVLSDRTPIEQQKNLQMKPGSSVHETETPDEQVTSSPGSLGFDTATRHNQSFSGLSVISGSGSKTQASPHKDAVENVTPDPAPAVTSINEDASTTAKQTGCRSPLKQEAEPKNSEVEGHHNKGATGAKHKSEEKRASVEAKLASKRQRQDMERREAEVLARREAQRIAKQKETEEKQRKAEYRRRVLAEAEKHRDEERRRKEQMRARKRQEEEEKQRIKKEEEDRRKEEHRRRVLEHKKQMDKAAQRKDADSKRPAKVSKLPRPKLGQHGMAGNQNKLKQHRAGQTHPRLPPTGSSRVAKVVTTDSLPPPPPKTPRMPHDQGEVGEPQWVMTGERKRGFSETSSDERERRRQKTVPSWAGSQKLWSTLQSEKSDPDTLFARGVPSCNLETVFEVDEEKKRKYRTRDDSGDWTKDRLTAQEEMQYKRQAGFFDNA